MFDILDVADRQNAHSMTLAVRLMSSEKETEVADIVDDIEGPFALPANWPLARHRETGIPK
jgi:hypothetical protein